MVPTGPSDMNGTSQPVPASLLRSSSGLLGTQNGANAMPSQSPFPSILSPQAQFNNSNRISNGPNVSSLVYQSFGNGGPNGGLGNVQRGMIENGAERDSISSVGNGISFNSQQSFVQSNLAIPGSSGHMLGQQFLNPLDQQSQQFDPRNFQLNQQQLQQLSGSQNQCNFNSVKLEPQQIPQTMRSVKTELQQPDQSLFIQPQPQQMLQMPRSSPQDPINLLHQQRLFQYQQQQQQQLALKSLPLRHPSQTALQAQNFPLRPPPKSDYEPGMGARRLMRYMFEQRQRPEDNNIEFWRKFVVEFFAPNAKKKWCVSMYGSGRQTTGVLPQDVWQCEICNCKPGRGFEATAGVLPRLFKIKYESGTLEELLYIDMPKEYQNSAGQIILDYAKAIQESVFDQLRVVRDGQLRIVFSPELKICSWEFCARRHDELIPRRSLIPQVSLLGAAAQNYQASTQAQSTSSNSSVPELQNNCNTFVASAKQVAKALEVPLVNDLGYSKRYVRCLQISEVVNSMRDLIDYSRETATGPMESLAKFPRRTSTQSADERQQLQSPPQQQTMVQTSQVNSANGVPMSVNHSLTSAPAMSSANATTGVLRQNSMTSRPQYPMTANTNSQLPNTTPSNNGPQNSSNISIQQPAALSGDNSQSSVQKITNQMITNTQPGMGSFGNNMQSVNRVIPTTNGTSNSVRGSMENNVTMVNGRVGTSHQQGLGGTLTSGLGAVNGFNNLQFDWKPSP